MNKPANSLKLSTRQSTKLKTLIDLLLAFMLLAATLMWLSSYTHYTSIGIDVDMRQDKQISHHYYRVRWPGNGSIWLGGGVSQRASDPDKPYEPFDLAATFLASNPEKPQATSMLNRFGFWYPKTSQQWWVGVPSFMPVLLLGFCFFGCKTLRLNTQ